MTERWRQPAQELREFAGAIGLNPERLDEAEWPHELVYDESAFKTDKLNLPEDAAARTERLNALHQVMLNLVEKYGEALTLRLNLGVSNLIVNHALSLPAIESFCQDVEGSPFEIHLRIDKSMLATHWDFTGPSTIYKIFLFPNALNRALGVSLTQLEQERGLMRGVTGEHKLVVLVPDYDNVALNDDYLAILCGEDNVRRWKDYLPTAQPEDALNKIQVIRNELIERPTWTGIEIQSVTPLHLYVNWPGDPRSQAEPIVQKLFGQLLVCSLLYVASTARIGTAAMVGAAANEDYPWTFTFSADKYSAKIEVPNNAAIMQLMTIADGPRSAWNLGELAKWVFEDESGLIHRQAVVQAVLASALEDFEPSQNLNELIRRSEELTGRVRHRWDDFMVDKLGKYFLQLKQIEDTVTSTTNNHAEQIQSLTKSLTDNMLAAVGVVVGSFIAAIFKSPFENYIFWIGTGIYLAYLVVFPIGVGMVSAWQRFRGSHEAFQKSERDFGGRLSPAEVAQIVGTTVKNSESWFTKWFCFTSAAYAVVVVVLLISMWALPAEIRNWTDNFELDSLDYSRSQPASSDVVPLIIRGANFDKDKEIVAKIGDATFTNTDGLTLKVLGSSILTLVPKQEDLTKARLGSGQAVLVTQGAARARGLSLPSDLAPIPKPEFDKWTAGPNKNSVAGYGSNFGSISEITYKGRKVNHTTSTDLKSLVISETDASKEPWHGRRLEVRLKNGDTISSEVTLTNEKNCGPTKK